MLNFLIVDLNKILRHLGKQSVLVPRSSRPKKKAEMTAQRKRSFKPCIIVHGGAGTISSVRRISSLSVVKEAVKAGYNVLLEVSSSFKTAYQRIMTSRRPYWCHKTMKQRPCWCPKLILLELDSFLMQKFSFVPINLHRWWPREWKRSILIKYLLEPINFFVYFTKQGIDKTWTLPSGPPFWTPFGPPSGPLSGPLFFF